MREFGRAGREGADDAVVAVGVAAVAIAAAGAEEGTAAARRSVRALDVKRLVVGAHPMKLCLLRRPSPKVWAAMRHSLCAAQCYPRWHVP